MEKKKYPIHAEDYELFEMIGDGGSAVVHRARCIPFDEIVAVKIMDFERNSDLSTISREAQTMILIDHPNILKALCSFGNGHDLWVVMPYMAGGSCLHIMKSAYPNGFEEVIIATVLREVLKGLEYLHQHGHIHRDVKAGNILVDARGNVKLGDFGVSASLFDSGDRQRTRNTFVGTPCWMAPEVMEQRYGYDFKADIWSFGITALELAHGHAPFSSQPPVKVFLMTLNNAPPSLESRPDKKFSKSFKQMIAACLVKDPSKRPTAHKLLKQSFFKQARSHDYISRKILEGLPSLEDRFHALKLKEAELLAQKKMLDGEKEAISQDEYKRGISSWNFDIDDLKSQAALIHDNEDVATGKDGEGCSSSFSDLDTLHEHVAHGISLSTSNLSLNNDASIGSDGSTQSRTDSPNHPSSFQRPKLDVPDNEHKISGHLSDQSIIRDNMRPNENGITSDRSPCGSDTEMHPDNTLGFCSSHKKTSTNSCTTDILSSSKQDSVKQHNPVENAESSSISHATAGIPVETTPKISKLAGSHSDDNDEKLKATLVQQKGRFKVTSENLDLEKSLPSAAQPKSSSSQMEAVEREKQLLQEIADLQKRLILSEEELRRTKAKIAQDGSVGR